MDRAEITQRLEEGPDKAAEALLAYKNGLTDLDDLEAKTYFKIKAQEIASKPTETHLKNLVSLDPEVYKKRLDVNALESEHFRQYERYMAAKILSRERTAF